MKFITSLTVDASLLRKLLRLWDESGDPRDPFAHVLVTPLFASASTLDLIRKELKEKRGATVYFDSGGYYVQQDKISFDELYCTLRTWYSQPENQWADWYVVPDHVPTSQDTPETVERKVNETIAAARMFKAEIPAQVGERLVPVVQGHTLEQVNHCIDAYLDTGADYIGFGSFGTGSADVSINRLDQRSANLVAHLAGQLVSKNIKLHTFGISTPPAVYAFKQLGFYSFDSLGWQRSAGYGKVYLPFTRAYNVSHRSIKNGALTREEFERLKDQTGHACPFCEDFHALSEQRLFRSLHNLVVLSEAGTVPQTHLHRADIASIIEAWSPRYYRIFEEVYNGKEITVSRPQCPPQ